MDTGQTRLLARHFFRRFFDNDLVSPNGDAHDNLGLVFTFLAMPGLWATLLLVLKYNNPWVSPAQRLLISVGDTFLLMAVSTIVMAVVTFVQWDALWLEGRDLAVLGPLPISRATLIRAKLRALALFVGCFAVAVNGFPILLYPLVLIATLTIAVWRGVWLMVALAGTLLAAAAFGFLVVLGLRALLVTCLGPRLFRRISVAVQLVSVFLLSTLYLMLPGLSRTFAPAAVAEGRGPALLVPPLWFLGLYETLTEGAVLRDPGVMSGRAGRYWPLADESHARAVLDSYAPSFHRLALIAAAAFVGAALIALVLYYVSQRRQIDAARPAAGAGAARRWLARTASRVATRILVRDPVAQATFVFTLQAVSRSATHRLYLAGYLAAGFALSAAGVSSLLARQGFTVVVMPGTTQLGVQFVLSFFLLLGLRVAFSIPSELRSNWIFQLDFGGAFARAMRGVRRALLLSVVVLLGTLAPLHALLWGPRVALLHLGFGLLAASILIEALLLRLRKLPFTCSYLPGKGNLKVYWPLYLLGFASYCYLPAAVEARAIREGGSGVLAGVLAVLLIVVVVWRRHALARVTRPVFEELPDPAAVSLSLSEG